MKVVDFAYHRCHPPSKYEWEVSLFHGQGVVAPRVFSYDSQQTLRSADFLDKRSLDV